MITFGERNCDNMNRVKVGTQLANIPSVRMYEKLGFRKLEAYNVFHYHSRKWGKR